LLIFIIPSGLLILAIFIALIFIIHQSYNWIQRKIISIQSILLRINPIIQKIFKTSSRPIIFIESILTIIKKKTNHKGQ
jgi:hypothetical protein